MARYNAEMGPPPSHRCCSGWWVAWASWPPSFDARTERMGLTPGSAEPRFPGYDVVGSSRHGTRTPTSVVVAGSACPGQATVLHGRGGARGPRPAGPPARPGRGTPGAGLRGHRRASGRTTRRWISLRGPPRGSRGMAPSVPRSTRRPSRTRAVLRPTGAPRATRIIEGVRLCKGNWHGLPAARVFSLWMRYACSAFYSHPWAWNEIGFGGPAYPRGYKYLASGAPRALGGPRA